MINQNIIRETTPVSQLLVLPLSEQAQRVQYQLDILVRHRPDSLLPCILRFCSGEPQLCLDITGLRSLDQIYEGEDLNAANGRSLILNLLDILIESDDRLLPTEQFLLRPESIFFYPDLRLVLAFWPVRALGLEMNSNRDNGNELRDLLQSLGAAFGIAKQEIGEYGDKLQASGLNGLREYLFMQTSDPAPDYSPPDLSKSDCHSRNMTKNNLFLELAIRMGRISRLVLILLHGCCLAFILLMRWQKSVWPISVKIMFSILILILLVLDFWHVSQSQHQKKRHDKIDGRNKTDQSAPSRYRKLLQKMQEPINSLLSRWKEQSRETPWGDHPETDGQTVLLSTNPADFRMALLAEGKPGTPEENEGIRAYILIDEFIVGRDQKLSDLCLPDPEIGRQHARILRREGSFFICDLGSRNGTSLNGRRLMKHVESLLPDQCLIKFAEQQFYFMAD